MKIFNAHFGTWALLISLLGLPFATTLRAQTPCTFAISPAERTHNSGTSTGLVSVATFTNCVWNVINTNGWLAIMSGSNGTGNGLVRYFVSANATTSTRVGYLFIAGQWFGVTQLASTSAPCTFVIASTSATHIAGTSSGMVSVITTEGCPWTVVNTNTWVTIISGSNVGNKFVTYSVAPNFTGAPRTGNLLIAGQLFSINQSESTPNLIISTAAIDVGPWDWATSPSPWRGQNSVTHDGIDAAQSGSIADGQSSYFSLVYVDGPASVSFWWKVSSEANNDVLRFSINNVEQARISGEVDWQQRTFTIPAGEFNELAWTYSKNSSVAVGQDRGWLDQVQITPSPSCNFSISPASRLHQSGATNGVVIVNNTFGMCPWWVLNTNSWIQFSSAPYGFGNGSITYDLAENPNPGPRSGYLVFEDRAFLITQAGYLNCTYSLSAANRSYGGGATNDSVTITTISPLCPWTVSTANAWITILSEPIGSGNGSVSYALAANPDPQPRSGSIVIGAETLIIVQAVDPTILTQPGNQTVPPGGTATFSVAASGTSPLTYQWLFNGAPLADGEGISGTTTPTLTLTGVQESQAGGYRVVISNAVRIVTSSVATLTVSCGFALFPRNASYSSNAATGFINVSAAPSCEWSVINTNPWVTILSITTNFGNGTVVYSVTENPATMARSGTIVIAEQNFVISQSGDAPTNATVSLAEALDTGDVLPWGTTGTPAWFGQSSVSHDGEDAAQSGPITANGAVTVQTTVNGPGTISFWWKVSSETNKDYLKFFINGVQQLRISGEVGWQLRSLPITAPTNILKWTYSKNAGGTEGLDRGWLDQVRFLPGTGCVVTLLQMSATNSGISETGQVTVAAAAGCKWAIDNTNSWIIPLVDVGEGDGYFRYSVAANTSTASRSGILTIGGRPLTVVQLGAPCTLSILRPSATFDFLGGSGGIDIITPTGCPWSPVNTNDWVTIIRVSGPSGSGGIDYSVAANPSTSPRSGTINIAGQNFLVTQAGRSTNPPPVCPASISPTSLTIDYRGAYKAIAITGPMGCQWERSVINTNDWVTINALIPNYSGGGQLIYTVAENETRFARTGNIRIGDQLFSISQSTVGIPLLEALDGVGPVVSWGTGGLGGGWPWIGQSAVTHDGVDAAESGAVGDSPSDGQGVFGASSGLHVVVTGPGTATFWWKVSSQTNHDGLHLYMSAGEEAFISGEVDWQQRTVAVPAGMHSLEWQYIKDSSGAAGADRGWVDQVQFIPTGGCTFTLSPLAASRPSNSSTGTVNIGTSPDCTWSVSNPNSWISFTSSNGTGSSTLTYIVAANPTASTRTGLVQIASQIFRITQTANTNPPPPNCTYAISPSSRVHNSANSTGLVHVTAQAGCAWNAFTTNAWVTILSGANNPGSSQLLYSIAANNSPANRTGVITVAGKPFTILQLAATTTDFNAARDFDAGSNPSGVWSYGWKSSLTGSLNVFPNARRAAAPNAMPYDIWEGELTLPNVMHYPWSNPDSGINGTSDLPPGTLLLDPGVEGSGKNFTVARFTAPSNGFYRIETGVAPCYGGPPQGDSDFHVVKNGIELAGRFLPTTEHFGYGAIVLLNSGDTVDFAVGRGADNSEYGSILKLTAILTPTEAPALPQTTEFDLGRDFSAANNPNGVWTFGWAGTVTGPVQPLTVQRNSPVDGGYSVPSWQFTYDMAPVVYCNTTGHDTTIGGGIAPMAANEVFFDGGQDGRPENFVVIQFTAPSNGLYTVATTVKPVYNGSPGGDADLHIVKNDTELFTRFLTSFQSATFTNALNLNAGDTLKFLLGRGTDGQEYGSIYRIAAVINSHASSTNPPPVCTYSLAPSSRTHGADSATGLVTVTTQSGCAWNVFNTNGWIHITSSLSNAGNSTVSYFVDANPGFSRSGNIRIDGQNFLVTQSPGSTNPPPSCTFVLSSTFANHNSGTSTNIVSVTTSSNCLWLVNNTNSWITVLSPATNIGHGTAMYFVTANPSAAIRAGNIRIDGQNFLVTQAGSSNVPPECSIALSPLSRKHGTGVATGLVSVTTQPGCAWSVIETNTWISILSSLNSSNSGTVRYFLQPNTNSTTRTGIIRIGGENFLVTQLGTSSGTNAPRLQLIGRTGTGATLSVEGEAGRTYVVECSEDLIHWIPISTNLAPATVTDTPVGDAPRRFYRTVESP